MIGTDHCCPLYHLPIGNEPISFFRQSVLNVLFCNQNTRLREVQSAFPSAASHGNLPGSVLANKSAICLNVPVSDETDLVPLLQNSGTYGNAGTHGNPPA